MAWIESHQEVAQHPKTRKLCRLLKIGVPQAVGHLHLLWWWALSYAQDGDLSRYDEGDISDACLWEGDPASFVSAMTEARFLDVEPRRVHDWDIYAGRLLSARERNRVKLQAYRERNRPELGLKPLRNGYEPKPNLLTEPNRTEPTEPEHSPASPAGEPEGRPAPVPPEKAGPEGKLPEQAPPSKPKRRAGLSEGARTLWTWYRAMLAKWHPDVDRGEEPETGDPKSPAVCVLLNTIAGSPRSLRRVQFALAWGLRETHWAPRLSTVKALAAGNLESAVTASGPAWAQLQDVWKPEEALDD